MPITKLLTGLPNRLMPQNDFDNANAQLYTDLPIWGQQANELAAGMNAVAAGGGFSIPYTFSTTTTDADPTPGYLRLSSATQNAATVMRVDLNGADGTVQTAVLDAFDDSNSATKGQIRLVKLGDPSKWLVFTLTSIASPSGYKNFTVVPIGGSAASPFVNGDSLVLFFTRTGDKGDVGPEGAGSVVLLGTAVVGATVANIDFLTVFSAAYNRYTIEVEGVSPSATAALLMLIARAGAVDGGAYYSGPSVDGAVQGAPTTNFALTGISTAAASGPSYTIDIRNANSTTKVKGVGIRGVTYDSAAAAYKATIREGAFTFADAISGFRLYWSGSASFTAGTVRVFGHRNA